MKINLPYWMLVSKQSLVEALINHFNYSIKDINSYDELTDSEKKIISKEQFDLLVG